MTHTPPPTQDDLAAGRRQEMTEQEKDQLVRSVRSSERLSGLNLSHELLRIMLEEVLHEEPLSLDAPLICQWCEYEAFYSINWECGHASAMCNLCFEPSDARDWTMDLMDWQQVPAICPDCAG